MLSKRPMQLLKSFFIMTILLGSITMYNLVVSHAQASDAELYVSVSGNDSNSGTKDAPFRTIAKAKEVVRGMLPSANGPIHVWIRGGTYYLDSTLAFTPEDSGTADKPITYSAYENEKVIISGGQRLAPEWSVYSGNIMMADIGTGLSFDQLFVNAERQILARYPNYNSNTAILNGYASDAVSAARAARWSDPTTGFVRGLHNLEWGGNSYKITGMNNGTPVLEWVGDNNRGGALHTTYRMVENIFEELDAPGEWFYNEKTGKLYFYPPAGLNLNQAVFETASLEELIRITGTASDKVKHIAFSGLTFTETARTLFTRPYEGLMRGDWAVARAGAMFIADAENITIQNSMFDHVGGNAIFISGYNRNHLITNNEFTGSGSTDVLIAGLQSAVRYPSTWSNQHTDIQDVTPGPLTEDYPQYITVSYNHMYNMGVFEKQSAGVCISVSRNVTVSHNTIHHSPRSGVNINDGTWGGHIIEYNDIFDTVLETSDHGPFNSWGRDRFWSLNGGDAVKKQYAFLDAMETVVIRNNRIWHNSSWDIDLDDGSTNYDIYNNLLLNAGFKLREGFSRKVHNNIIVNGSGHFHVAYEGSNDVIKNNIFLTNTPYAFIQTDAKKAGNFYDNNLFWNNGKSISGITGSWIDSGFDVHSLIADPLFVGSSPFTDLAKKNFTVQPDSPALALGFQNFSMTEFGKPGAPTPPNMIWDSGSAGVVADTEPLMGASVSSIYSDLVMSSVGLGDANGLYLYDVPGDSYAAQQGFVQGDVIRSLNGTTITNKTSFWHLYNRVAPGGKIKAEVWRNQASVTITFNKISGVELVNDSAGVVYTGDGWDYKNSSRGGANSYNNDLYATTANGDFFEFTFNGTGIDYISQVNVDEGNIDIYMDGVFQETISAYNGSRIYQTVIYSKRNLTPGIHTIKGVKKSSSYLIVDAFKIYGEAVKENPTAVISGADEMMTGQEYNLSYGLQDLDTDVLAQDITVQFDKDKLELTGVDTLVDGLSIIEQKVVAPGQVRLILASMGAGSAINHDAEVLQLSWRVIADEAGSTSVALSNITLADPEGAETELEGVSHSIRITLKNPGIKGDLNGDLKVTIGDLAILAKYYGKSSADSDWEQFKWVDLNGDDKIDIADLVFIAKLILESE